MGLADLSARRPLDVDSLFYLGSVSKQFTATCVLTAVRQRRLALDDLVRHWVPELPAWAEPVVVDDLLHHVSGLRDYFSMAALAGRPEEVDASYDADRLLETLRRQGDAGVAPGERFDYSNTNYVLLSLIVERATGSRLTEYARDEIFEPLGMRSTFFLAGARPVVPHARAYRNDGRGWVQDDPVLGVVGDGGLRSTVADLVVWSISLFGGGVDPAIADALVEPCRLRGGEHSAYGRGLIHGRFRGRPVTPAGSAPGVHTFAGCQTTTRVQSS